MSCCCFSDIIPISSTIQGKSEPCICSQKYYNKFGLDFIQKLVIQLRNSLKLLILQVPHKVYNDPYIFINQAPSLNSGI